jgi:hypothetical protein
LDESGGTLALGAHTLFLEDGPEISDAEQPERGHGEIHEGM